MSGFNNFAIPISLFFTLNLFLVLYFFISFVCFRTNLITSLGLPHDLENNSSNLAFRFFSESSSDNEYSLSLSSSIINQSTNSFILSLSLLNHNSLTQSNIPSAISARLVLYLLRFILLDFFFLLPPFRFFSLSSSILSITSIAYPLAQILLLFYVIQVSFELLTHLQFYQLYHSH